MGCGASRSKEDKAISKELDAERRRRRNEIRLLLLGPGESGKSTIFKQMKILQLDGGFSQEEMVKYRNLVFRNCVSEMKVLTTAAQKLEIPLSSTQIQQYAQWFLDQVPIDGSVWTMDVANVIKLLWADSGVQKTYALRGSHYHLNDTAPYFFENIDRFIAADYVPTQADILRTRIRSTGIEEADFHFADMNFKMMDVGGQRSERRKWIHCFEKCITAIVFCAALSCYDQVLREDDQTNAMKDTLDLFEEIANSPFFSSVALILLLNKRDLFEEKIKTVDLKVWNPNYTGGHDYDKGLQFIRDRFHELHPRPDMLFIHPTIAIDSQNVDLIFRAVRSTILRLLLGDVTPT
eukprot:TRINITY_DN6297_c0_g1_i1.p1 TRINITY_DN6297_c0_g1~~TRINITY_DN6297_c0_g1_i1.p1  ORF type:complete len:350 (-),score=49.34 TRINITY_DN6297_c0_g1_i1:199-1248(-)